MGYTQGMNYVVGFLVLCGFEKQELFWMMVGLLAGRRFLMLGMFEDDFPLVQLYMTLFQQRLRELEPALADHLERSAVPNEAWLFQWMLTWFLYSFGPEQAVLVWDFVLQRDGPSVIAVALSVVMELASQIIAIEPGYKVFAVLRSDSLGATINLERVL